MSKEDKIIRDLKRRNDSLLHQFEMTRMREINFSNKCDRLKEENKHLKDLQQNMDKQYEKLENNWNELKKLLKEEIDICDGCIDTLRSDLQELHPRSCGKTYLQNEILKNKTAKRSFEITLDKMQELEGNNANTTN